MVLKDDAADIEIEPTIGQLVQEATTSLSTIIHGEIELAKLELRSSVKNGGTGAVFFLTAAVIAVFSLTFLFITFAEILIAIGLPRWSGYGIVTLFFLLLAGLLVFLGVRKVKKVKAPERTITTGKETAAYIKSARQRS